MFCERMKNKREMRKPKKRKIIERTVFKSYVRKETMENEGDLIETKQGI